MNTQFHKQCEVCCSSNWCVLNDDTWVCIACVEDRIRWEEE
jgi:hypothetical protein